MTPTPGVRQAPPAGACVQVRVPASSANLGPGFDSFGLALGIWDQVQATVTEQPGVNVQVAGVGAGEVPTDERHLVAACMLQTWQLLQIPRPIGLRLECENAVPHGRGMGSSATAVVAGVSAALALALPGALDLALINRIAGAWEGHPDNSSASVYGGATLSWMSGAEDSADRLAQLPQTHTVRLSIHPDIEPVVFVPQAQLATAYARAALPTQVSLVDAAANTARGALLVHALTKDPALLLEATEDRLHQEPRRVAYAESMDLVDRLRAAGHPATISGAGPCVLVLATPRTAANVASAASPPWQVMTPGVAQTGVIGPTVVHW